MQIIIFSLCLILSLNVSKSQAFFQVASSITEDSVRLYGKSTIEKKAFLTSYDFIIVGSGPGGCVLANRLSSHKSQSILLIEAGTLETIVQSVPLSAPYNVASRYNWGYLAEAQNFSCLGAVDGRCGYPRGKALGGSSVINGMLYTRGSKGDFDHWKQLGIDNWDYFDDVLPAFKKSENADLKYLNKPEFHGKNGFLSVVNNPFNTPMADVFVAGMKEVKIDEIDFNANDSIGIGRLQSNTKFGRRQSAFEAFLRPILHRTNLHVMLNTRVAKILINSATKTAVGVQIVRNRKTMKIFAKSEVILSAGAFHSPQLLILSGIGSADDLKRLKIQQIVDLQVGKEMHDHLVFGGVFLTTNLTDKLARPFEPSKLTILAADWLLGRGLLTLPNGAETLSFLRLENATTPVNSQPNVEFIVLGVNPTADGGYGLKNGERMSDLLYDSWLKPLESVDTFVISVGIGLLHPRSVGFMDVTSASIFDSPKFFSNFLKEPEDVETVISGVRFLQRLLQTSTFQKVGAKVYDRPMAMCDGHVFDSDDYWRCAVRTFSVSLHHQVGTCKMGSESDKTAVVDSKLKVLGLKKLRVVDTSVIPAATSAHTNALSYMIGERAAEFIEEEFGL